MSRGMSSGKSCRTRSGMPCACPSSSAVCTMICRSEALDDEDPQQVAARLIAARRHRHHRLARPCGVLRWCVRGLVPPSLVGYHGPGAVGQPVDGLAGIHAQGRREDRAIDDEEVWDVMVPEPGPTTLVLVRAHRTTSHLVGGEDGVLVRTVAGVADALQLLLLADDHGLEVVATRVAPAARWAWAMEQWPPGRPTEG